MIVIDASILSKYLLQEPDWEKVKPYIMKGLSLDFVLIEVTNAIWKDNYIHKKKVKDAFDKFNALKILFDGVLVIHESKHLMEESFKIAIQERVPIYDILYIVLSLAENLQLLTSDIKQAKIATKYNVDVLQLE